MKFISFNKWINENKKEGIIILFPGSFKPAHAGHIDIIRRYINHPDVKEVKVLIGTGTRNSITQKESKKIATLLLKDLDNVSIENSLYPSPILTAYKYIETAKPGIYAMAGSKKGEDYSRIERFVKEHQPSGKYFNTKPTNVNIIELFIDVNPLLYKGRTDEYEGETISASILRQDILNDDYNNFRTNYPGYDEKIIRKIWDETQIVITESLNEKFTQDSDPIADMNIGMMHQIKLWMKSIDESFVDKDHALVYSAAHGKLDFVEYLLAAGANVHTYDDQALRWVSHNGHTEVVKLLLAAGADVHTDDDWALQLASSNGHTEVVKVLLAAGADVHTDNDYALRWASEFGRTEVVKVLLAAGANVHADNDGALQWASRYKHTEVVKVLKDHITKEKRKRVKESVNEKFTQDSDPIADMNIGMMHQIKLWMESINEPFRDKDKTLIFSAYYDKLEFIEYLLAKGANVDANEDFLIKWASRNGHTEVVKILLAAGADVHANNDYALRWASESGHTEVVKILLAAGADVHADNDYALRWASQNGYTKVVKVLLAAGADVHAHNNSSLRWASDKGHPEVVKVLKDHIIKKRKVKESLLVEGGNVFESTGPIAKESIEPTLNRFKNKLNKIFPNVKFDFELLGSAGKKPISGDIDLALSEKTIFDANDNVKYENWNINPNDFEVIYEQIRKRVRNATEKQSKLRAAIKMIATQLLDDTEISTDVKNSTAGTLFCSFPQYNEKGYKIGKGVQIDINIGDLNWLRFSYHSETYESNVKGLHRTQLMVALFANKKRTFRHGTGVVNIQTGEYEAVSPENAIDLLNKLYNFKTNKLDKDIIGNFFKLHTFLIKNLSIQELHNIYDIYLRILDSTRTDIPEDLQSYWIENKDRLGLKGMFLPEDSNLYKYKQ